MTPVYYLGNVDRSNEAKETAAKIRRTPYRRRDGSLIHFVEVCRNMPRLASGALNAAVSVLHSKRDGDGNLTNEIEPLSGGTGFLVRCPSLRADGFPFVFAVTNSHVVPKDETTFVRVTLRDGDTQTIRIGAGNWFHHAKHDDVAVVPFPLSEAPELAQTAIDISWFARRDHPFTVGDDAFFIGRHRSLEAPPFRQNVLGMRTGNVSIIDVLPVFQGSDRPRHQSSMVVEARTYGGYSGSPVFVSQADYLGAPEFRRLKEIGPLPLEFEDEPVLKDWPTVVHKSNMESPFALLGMCWGHMGPTGPKTPGIPGMTDLDRQFAFNSGLMLVVPAWVIAENLTQSNVLEAQRVVEESANADISGVLDT